jgi:endonuclease YncB( thermonuclease family)
MSVTLRKRALLLLILSLSILSSCSRERTKSVSGTVVKIVDGDTINILDAQNVQHKIRLQGIDAPERKQAFNQVSGEHLAGLVFGKNVTVIFNPDNKYDRWGRIIGKVWVDGNDECLEQLRAGLAWHYKEYEKEQSPTDRQLYAKAEQEARTQKRGLWKDPAPTPPWEYRHHTKGSTAESDSPDEPTSADPNLRNGLPSLNSNSTNAPTSLASPTTNLDADGLIRGNKRSMIYHWPGCPNYDDIAPHNRVPFQTRDEAEKAGYRAARNCP